MFANIVIGLFGLLMVNYLVIIAVSYTHLAAGNTKDITSDSLFKEVFSVDVEVDHFDNKPYVRVKGLL